jgi:hypothetical protein
VDQPVTDIIRDMKLESWIALVATVIALGALVYGARTAKAATLQANAAKEQTAIQRQLRIDAAQPYVWVDLRPDDEHGGFLTVIVGNSGPTVATDVRVTFNPPLQLVVTANSRAEHAQHRLASGIPSLPPGRTLTWNAGVLSKVIDGADPAGYRATIHATGPFGPLAPLEYVIDIEGLRYTRATAPGTLNGVTLAINKLAKAVTGDAAN